MVLFCSQCGAPLEDNSRFCPNCGAPVSQPVPGGHGDRVVVISPPIPQRRYKLGVYEVVSIVLGVVAMLSVLLLPMLSVIEEDSGRSIASISFFGKAETISKEFNKGYAEELEHINQPFPTICFILIIAALLLAVLFIIIKKTSFSILSSIACLLSLLAVRTGTDSEFREFMRSADKSNSFRSFNVYVNSGAIILIICASALILIGIVVRVKDKKDKKAKMMNQNPNMNPQA